MGNATFNVAVIEGDGIGPDVVAATRAVIEAAQKRVGGFSLNFDYHAAGAGYYAEHGRDMAPGSEDAVAEGQRLQGYDFRKAKPHAIGGVLDRGVRGGVAAAPHDFRHVDSQVGDVSLLDAVVK